MNDFQEQYEKLDPSQQWLVGELMDEGVPPQEAIDILSELKQKRDTYGTN